MFEEWMNVCRQFKLWDSVNKQKGVNAMLTHILADRVFIYLLSSLYLLEKYQAFWFRVF